MFDFSSLPERFLLAGIARGPMIVRKYVAYLLPLLAVTALPVSGDDTSDPLIPEFSRTASGFVPKGWYLFEHAAGDLNRDGVSDLALVLASEQEKAISGMLTDDDPVPKRRLVIALGTSDGFRKAVVDVGAVQTQSGDHSLFIRGGVLTVKIRTMGGNGSDTIVDKYQWREGFFEQIGHTISTWFGGAGDFITDTNLITGLVEEFHETAIPLRYDVAEPRFAGKRSFRAIAVGCRPALPADLSLPLTAMPVQLRSRTDVSAGGSNWRGPNDFSATLTAAMVGNGKQARLCLRANVRDGRGDNADRVRLLSARWKLVRTASERRQRTAAGFAWEGWYDPGSLGLDYVRDTESGPTAATGSWYFHDKTDPHWGFLRGTVEVVRPQTGTTLSTSRGVRRVPGILWLTSETHLPRLGNDSPDGYGY